MPQSSQLDGFESQDFYLPYDKVTAELSNTRRLVAGTNTFVSLGGKLCRRPALVEVTNFTKTTRADRIWAYETLDNPPRLYFLGSFFTGSTWEMFYNRPSTATGWVSLGSLRNVNASTAPHEVVVSRGLAFIRGVPASGLGTVIFDGSGTPIVKFWGLEAPTVPARVQGAVDRLGATITDVATTISVVSKTGFPAGFPFTIQVEYEQMSVTADAGGLNYTVTRGFNGTEAVAHDDDTVVLYRSWSASDHRVDVNYGWTYFYAYKSSTGHLSNRSPVETNIDELPSFTGPFFDLKPAITVQGHADTTRIPTIVIYRSQDGGGIYYKLEEIANTGSGNITYTDDSLGTGASGTTFNDPLPDEMLDQASFAPSLVSNSPPPLGLPITVTTAQKSTRIVSFAGRLWYAIGNVLFYSAQEELDEGIPEEAFPSGLRANFFNFQHPIMNLASNNGVLYVFTTQNTHILTGSNKETFNHSPLFRNIGVPPGHPRAIVEYHENVAFLTHDSRIGIIDKQNEIEIISDALYQDLIDQIAISPANMECELQFLGDLDIEWLFVTIHRKDDPTYSRTWVYDLKLSKKFGKPFWNTPWTIPSTAVVSSRLAESLIRREMCFFIFDPAVPFGRLCELNTGLGVGVDTTVGSAIASGTDGIDFSATTYLHTVPEGDHVNKLRAPALTPVVQHLILERTKNSGDSDPDIFYFKDDLWTNPIPADYIEDPPRRDYSLGYKTSYAEINQVAYRFAFRVQKINSTSPIILQQYAVIYNPDGGV